MGFQTNRRQFLKTAAATGVGYWVAGGVQAAESTSPNQRVALGCVGVGGSKGREDVTDAGRNADVVAICDVDDTYLGSAASNFPQAKKFNDYRKMLDQMGDSIDAVTVTTPDHNHAAIGLMAMRMGKHCFCQKPMTRTIYEARLMGTVAREKGLATQMGNQHTWNNRLREAAAQIKAGMIGTVKEVHIWTNRPIWVQGRSERPAPADPPETLKWDLWLGTAPVRPFSPDVYHPFEWRGWWDFGSGALGDMACHTVNLPFMALNLRDPVSVQAVTSGHNKDSYPQSSRITYEFPELDGRPALKMVWYDGGQKIPADLVPGSRFGGSGALLIGEKTMAYSAGDYGQSLVLQDTTIERPQVEFRRTSGGSHFGEWVAAIKGGEPPVSNFPDYAGSLTESILLGNLAVYAAAGDGPNPDRQCNVEGPEVLWDAKNLKCTNIEGLEQIIKPVYREGHVLDV